MNPQPPHPKNTTCLIAALILLLTGCATLSGLEPPGINLAGLRIAEVKGFETVFEVDLRVLNPNKTALNIQGIDCDLSFNDRHLAKGVAGPQKEIPAYGSEIVTVMVYASMVDLFGAARRLIQGAQSETPDEKWSYAVNGNLDMGGGAWTGKMPFEAKGEINLKELMGKP
ncbi:MAG: LEA type 2 family protein [Desulfobacteraceae bacterium]|nr:LEA type 2 family protein [Desulfobacteraceae bacterium]